MCVELQVLLQPAVGVVDAAVQRQLRRPLLELVDRDLLQQRDRVVVAASRQRTGSSSRKRLVRVADPSSTTGSAPARDSLWCAGATNWPSVRASLTIGASCAPAIISSRMSSSPNVRASTVCTTSTPCRRPRSMIGTPRNERYGSSPASGKYLKRGCVARVGDELRPQLLGDEARRDPP